MAAHRPMLAPMIPTPIFFMVALLLNGCGAARERPGFVW